MKQIEFGYDMSMNPTGSHEGIGIAPGLMLTSADYYGVVSYDGNEHVVVKVTEDKYDKYPQLLDKFVVIDSAYDLYADGSGVLFLDQDQSVTSRQIEERINSDELKGKITNIGDVINYCGGGLAPAPIKYKLLEVYEEMPVVSTAIRHSVFEAKRDVIKNCHKSISDMQTELSNDYTR